MKQQTRGSLMLLLCAMVWGAAFVAQSEGMNYVGPFTMQAARYFLAGLVLVPVILLRDKKGISVRPSGMNVPVRSERKFVNLPKERRLSGWILTLITFREKSMREEKGRNVFASVQRMWCVN